MPTAPPPTSIPRAKAKARPKPVPSSRPPSHPRGSIVASLPLAPSTPPRSRGRSRSAARGRPPQGGSAPSRPPPSGKDKDKGKGMGKAAKGKSKGAGKDKGKSAHKDGSDSTAGTSWREVASRIQPRRDRLGVPIRPEHIIQRNKRQWGQGWDMVKGAPACRAQLQLSAARSLASRYSCSC